MSARSHNRGSRVIAASIAADRRARRTRVEPCGGTYDNGPGKSYARCRICRAVDYDKYEGDRCTRPVTVVYL